MLGGRNLGKNITVAFISSPTIPSLAIFNFFNCLALFSSKTCIYSIFNDSSFVLSFCNIA